MGERWIARGLRESCTILGDLQIEPDFLRFLRGTLHAGSIEEGIDLLKQYSDNREALKRFLAAEADLLSRAGLPISATSDLIQHCETIIVQGRFNERADIAAALTDLQCYVCERAERAELNQRRGLLGGMRDVLGGLAVVVLNGGCLAATTGISAASMQLGGVVIADGYKNIRSLF
jgi:hypothetical protein